MFFPKYTITNSILKNTCTVDVAKEVIETSHLIAVWENRFADEARKRIIAHSAQLEGSRLSQEEIDEILDGARASHISGEALQEIQNLKRVYQFIDMIVGKIGTDRPYFLTIETILEMHRLIMETLAPNMEEGKFRKAQVVIKNTKTGQISYSPPPANEIPYLIQDLVNWINDLETKKIHPVIKSGIIHYELSRIHPFMDGNGRVARALVLLILYLDGYQMKKFYCLEEYYNVDPMQYLLTMQSVSSQMVLDTHERDLTPWLEYFVNGFAGELNNVRERVKTVASETKVKDKLGESVVLTERQMIIMDFLKKNRSLTNKDFKKIFPDYSDDTVLRELKFLKQKGLVKKIGGTKKASYVIR